MLEILHIEDGVATPLRADEVASVLERPGFIWIDLAAPTDDEAAILETDHVALDPLLIEDMREDLHLPKLDIFADQLGLIVHGISVADASVEITTVELDIAVKQRILVTFHDEEVAALDAVRRRLLRGAAPGLDRPVLLLHLLLDVLNDVFVPFLDMIEQRLDIIEDDILTDPTETTRREIYGLQRDLIQLRRAVVPQAEVIRRLSRERISTLEEHDRALFRDIYDHQYRIVEITESYRQLLDSALDNYRSAQDDDLNQMLKVLTLFSAVLLPISVIAGIYGTNFVFVPELGVRWGYFGMLGSFVVIIVGQLLWFRSRGWIGDRAEREARKRRRGMAEVLEIPVLGQVLKVPAYGARAVVLTGKSVASLPGRIGRRNGDAGVWDDAPPPGGDQPTS